MSVVIIEGPVLRWNELGVVHKLVIYLYTTPESNERHSLQTPRTPDSKTLESVTGRLGHRPSSANHDWHDFTTSASHSGHQLGDQASVLSDLFLPSTLEVVPILVADGDVDHEDPFPVFNDQPAMPRNGWSNFRRFPRDWVGGSCSVYKKKVPTKLKATVPTKRMKKEIKATGKEKNYSAHMNGETPNYQRPKVQPLPPRVRPHVSGPADWGKPAGGPLTPRYQ
ncbi:hypothetical protein J6590_096129 [Homalodisca vitripennis]|nr:hypothetical protein J6590_096129 [Homalodisca vitripennis]